MHYDNEYHKTIELYIENGWIRQCVYCLLKVSLFQRESVVCCGYLRYVDSALPGTALNTYAGASADSLHLRNTLAR